MRTAPIPPARITYAVCEQKRFHPLLCLTQVLAGGRPRPSQILKGFIFDHWPARNARASFIASIRFNEIAMLLGNQRWRVDHAFEAAFHELAARSIATRGGLVGNSHVRSLRLHPLAQPINLRFRRADLAKRFDFASVARLGHRDRFLVHI